MRCIAFRLQNEDIEMPNSGDTVLVVEDEALIRWNIVDALEEAGFKVLEACNVVDAVAILGVVPDIIAVFTDVDMPGPKDGLDLAQVVSTDRPDVKILVASGRHRPANTDLPAECRFFAKPYNCANVIASLNEMLSAA